MDFVKNYNISVSAYSLLTEEEKRELDLYMESINCTYTITE